MTSFRKNSDSQERFWQGDFGDEYTSRSQGQILIRSNETLFSRVVAAMGAPPVSVLELGANRGLNLVALQRLLPAGRFTGLEINDKAFESLCSLDGINAIHGSIYDFSSTEAFDLVFTKGVLIHLNPERLPDVYRKLEAYSSKYILLAEYYNPSPVEVPYRNHHGKLFKRDFAGEMLELYPSLSLVDYGFCYHRDPVAPQDDITWFLLRKAS